MCGCGETTPIAKQSTTRTGNVRGQHTRFCHGHARRGVKDSDATIARRKRAYRKWRKENPDPRIGRSLSEETRKKIGDANRGSNSGLWRGGRTQHRGYILVKVNRDHPMANPRGYVLEHRLVIADHLGRPLTSDENVHHINDDRTDNRLENLMLVTRGEHSRITFTKYGPVEHARVKELLASGMTQQQVADELGMSQSNVSRIVQSKEDE